MQRRNLDFEIPVSRDQWEQLGRTAAARSPDGSGYRWQKGDFEVIHVFARDEDAPAPLQRHVTEEHRYGFSDVEVARFVFNDGRPYAELQPPDAPDEPILTEAQEQGMRREIERWVRGKWHGLLEHSGLHYERGHIPT